MKLIGMLDSPFVRRIAITLRWLDIKFEHQALSVFADLEQFSRINPLTKAPSFICDDGTVLMDSPLILQYAELYSNTNKGLANLPKEEQSWMFRVLGLAQITADKLVQIYYEREMRPSETRYPKWEQRITKQIEAGFQSLEESLALAPSQSKAVEQNQATIAIVTAVHFQEDKQLAITDLKRYPKLHQLWSTLEQQDNFKEFPPVGPEQMPI